MLSNEIMWKHCEAMPRTVTVEWMCVWQMELVVCSSAIQYPHLHVRRGTSLHASSTPGRLARARNILLVGLQSSRTTVGLARGETPTDADCMARQISTRFIVAGRKSDVITALRQSPVKWGRFPRDSGYYFARKRKNHIDRPTCIHRRCYECTSFCAVWAHESFSAKNHYRTLLPLDENSDYDDIDKLRRILLLVAVLCCTARRSRIDTLPRVLHHRRQHESVVITTSHSLSILAAKLLVTWIPRPSSCRGRGVYYKTGLSVGISLKELGVSECLKFCTAIEI